MDNETLARNHFEALEHDGGLVAYYHVDDRDYFVIARPPYGSGHRLSTTVPVNEVDGKVIDYIRSVGMNFSFNDLLVKEFEVFDGEVC